MTENKYITTHAELLNLHGKRVSYELDGVKNTGTIKCNKNGFNENIVLSTVSRWKIISSKNARYEDFGETHFKNIRLLDSEPKETTVSDRVDETGFVKLKLEVGKRYVTRGADDIFVIFDEPLVGVFRGACCESGFVRTWNKDGHPVDSITGSIIAEYKDHDDSGNWQEVVREVVEVLGGSKFREYIDNRNTYNVTAILDEFIERLKSILPKEKVYKKLRDMEAGDEFMFEGKHYVVNGGDIGVVESVEDLGAMTALENADTEMEMI